MRTLRLLFAFPIPFISLVSCCHDAPCEFWNILMLETACPAATKATTVWKKRNKNKLIQAPKLLNNKAEMFNKKTNSLWLTCLPKFYKYFRKNNTSGSDYIKMVLEQQGINDTSITTVREKYKKKTKSNNKTNSDFPRIDTVLCLMYAQRHSIHRERKKSMTV